MPNQRDIISLSSEILLTISTKNIDQMMQDPPVEINTHFSIEALTETYQKLDFSEREQFFHIFLPENTQFPRKNTSYPSSMFPD